MTSRWTTGRHAITDRPSGRGDGSSQGGGRIHPPAAGDAEVGAALTISIVVFIALQYPLGASSDRIGRKPMMLVLTACYTVAMVPLSSLIIVTMPETRGRQSRGPRLISRPTHLSHLSHPSCPPRRVLTSRP